MTESWAGGGDDDLPMQIDYESENCGAIVCYLQYFLNLGFSRISHEHNWGFQSNNELWFSLGR